MSSVIFALWFFLPAGIANMTPILVARLPWFKDLQTPLDFGKEWRGKRLFGSNKTWRGVVCGTIAGMLVALVEAQLFFRVTESDNYWSVALVGALLGFGALFGDAVESFIKRRRAIKPGQSWFPFDQLDYIIGGLVFVSPVVMLTLSDYVAVIIVWFFLHLLTSYVGFLFKFKSQPI